MRFDIITIFPRIFDSYFNESIIKRAQEQGLIKIKIHNLRDFAADKRKTAAPAARAARRGGQVDDKPYGGGAGMVMMAGPVIKAVGRIAGNDKNKKTKIVLFSAKGKPFSQKVACDWAKKYDRLIFVSGRYEGVDERVKKILKAEEVSIGPYVLTDGDAAAMVVISAVARLVSGVIKPESLEEESFGFERSRKNKDTRLLEYPHYTRPEVIVHKGKKYGVPGVLLSGNHGKIEEWRKSRMKA